MQRLVANECAPQNECIAKKLYDTVQAEHMSHQRRDSGGGRGNYGSERARDQQLVHAVEQDEEEAAPGYAARVPGVHIIYLYVYIYIYIYIHTYKYIYIYIHIHT